MLTWPPSGLSKAQQEEIESAASLTTGVVLLTRALPRLDMKTRVELVRQALDTSKKARAKAKGRWK